MKTQRKNRREGGVLLMAMLVMLVFTTLAIGLFKLFQTDAVETVYVEQHRRALWLAEAGLEKAIDFISWDKTFRSNPDLYLPYTAALSNGTSEIGTYTIKAVDIVNQGTNGSLFTVTSVGYAGSLNRVIQQQLQVFAGGKYALFAMGGDTQIDSNVEVNGDFYQLTGSANIDSKQNLNKGTGINGFVAAGDGGPDDGNITGNGVDDILYVEVPIPTPPSIDTTIWVDGYIAAAYADSNAVSIVTNGYASPLVLNLQTNFNLASGMTFPSDQIISIFDSNNTNLLVNTGDITFDNWADIRDGSIIVADGDITFDQKVTLGKDTIIFATGSIYIKQASDSSISGTTLLALEDIELAQQLVFKGIIFGLGKVTVGSNAEVEGTIIAGDGIEINSNAKITYNPDVFLNPLIGVDNVLDDANYQMVGWREIAPE